MAGAAHVGAAALFDALIGAVSVTLVVMLAAARADELLEIVIKAFSAKVILLLRDPFLQPKMRLDHELGHHRLPCARKRDWPTLQLRPPARKPGSRARCVLATPFPHRMPSAKPA